MYLFLFFIFWLPQQSPNWFWYKRKLCWKNILTKLPSSIQVHYNTLIKWHMIWWCCTTFLVTIASGFLMNFPFFYAHCMCFINAYISMISYLTSQERDPLDVCLLFKCRKCWAKNDMKRISNTSKILKCTNYFSIKDKCYQITFWIGQIVSLWDYIIPIIYILNIFII